MERSSRWREREIAAVQPAVGPGKQAFGTNSQEAAERLEANCRMDDLILRVSARRGPDCYDVLSDGEVVGCIAFATFTPPLDSPWMWTLAHAHCDQTPTCGFAVTREAALMAFARRWRREG